MPAGILPGVMQNGWMPPRRVFVLGAGAIGASVGALLFEAGVDCVFVVRDSEHGRAIVERGVNLRFPNAARTIRVPTATTTTATPGNLVLLATMGHETEAALEGVDPHVTVASFQNGVTPLDAIMRHGHETLAAMVYIPAERRGPGDCLAGRAGAGHRAPRKLADRRRALWAVAGGPSAHRGFSRGGRT